MPTLIQVDITWVTGTFHHACQFVGSHELGQFQHLAFFLFQFFLLQLTVLYAFSFSFRYLAALFLPLFVRRANVSFTCFATSSSLTSGFTTAFLKTILIVLPLPAMRSYPTCFITWHNHSARN